MEKMNSRTIVRSLKKPESYAPLLAIRNAREYDAAVEKLNALVDEIGDNPKDPRYRLIDTLSILVEAYDKEHYSIPDTSGVEMLRFLMEQHGLTQGDLPEVGTQGGFMCRRGCFFANAPESESEVGHEAQGVLKTNWRCRGRGRA
jgi:antitoxin component HigA of HigAB toxin-antitoxin module